MGGLVPLLPYFFVESARVGLLYSCVRCIHLTLHICLCTFVDRHWYHIACLWGRQNSLHRRDWRSRWVHLGSSIYSIGWRICCRRRFRYCSCPRGLGIDFRRGVGVSVLYWDKYIRVISNVVRTWLWRLCKSIAHLSRANEQEPPGPITCRLRSYFSAIPSTLPHRPQLEALLASELAKSTSIPLCMFSLLLRLSQLVQRSRTIAV